MTSSKRQRGFSLLELIVTLVISMVIIAGVYALGQVVWRNVHVSALVDELGTITTAMNGKYGVSAKTAGTPYTSVNTMDVVTAVGDYGNVTAGTVTTPFATLLYVVQGNLFGTFGDSYRVGLQVPVEACPDVINNESNLFDAIAVRSLANYVMAPIGVTVPAGVTAGQPPSPTVISAACAGTGFISLFFYKV